MLHVITNPLSVNIGLGFNNMRMGDIHSSLSDQRKLVVLPDIMFLEEAFLLGFRDQVCEKIS